MSDSDPIVILSDLHLGSSVSRAARAADFLRRLPADLGTLVVAGDLLDGPASIDAAGWPVLAELHRRAVSTSVWLLPGNHDGLVAPDVARSLGLHYAPDALFYSGDKRVFVTHGHTWDPFLESYPALTAAGNAANAALGAAWPGAARSLKHLRKYLFNVRRQVRDGARALGAERNYDVVVCGHTHLPEALPADPAQGLPGYVNAGSWCETEDTYVLVAGGEARLCRWDG